MDMSPVCSRGMCLFVSVCVKLVYNYVVKNWILHGSSLVGKCVIYCSNFSSSYQLFCSIQLMKWRKEDRKLHCGSRLMCMQFFSELVCKQLNDTHDSESVHQSETRIGHIRGDVRNGDIEEKGKRGKQSQPQSFWYVSWDDTTFSLL